MGALTNETFQLGNEFNQKLDTDMLIDDTHTREFYMTSQRVPLVGKQAFSLTLYAMSILYELWAFTCHAVSVVYQTQNLVW